MSEIVWPKEIQFSVDIEEKGDRLFKKYTSSSESISDNYMDIGGGRVVFDISDISSKPSVLKIAHNQYGASEIVAENRVRQNIEGSLSQYLVPNVRTGTGWAVQPKCEKPSNPKPQVTELQYSETNAHDFSRVDEVVQLTQNH